MANKDHYDKIVYYISIPEDAANKMPTANGDFSLKQWREVHAFFADGSVDIQHLEPSILEYPEVQSATYEATFKCGVSIEQVYHNNARECLLWYYRDSNANEIDMVIESDDMLHPLEMKRSVNPGSELIGAFSHLDKASVPRGDGAILCMRPKLSAINSENYIVPIWMI